MDQFNLDALKRASALLRASAVPLLVIQTEAEARAATAADPTGRTWRVGDEYYLLCAAEGKVWIS